MNYLQGHPFLAAVYLSHCRKLAQSGCVLDGNSIVTGRQIRVLVRQFGRSNGLNHIGRFGLSFDEWRCGEMEAWPGGFSGQGCHLLTTDRFNAAIRCSGDSMKLAGRLSLK
ncbi:MAG: hypothetical protein J4F49_03350 [Rhodobacteraceae bacterium]|nr:hypothetical protein [Paracoccaceae bacterium]